MIRCGSRSGRACKSIGEFARKRDTAAIRESQETRYRSPQCRDARRVAPATPWGVSPTECNLKITWRSEDRKPIRSRSFRKRGWDPSPETPHGVSWRYPPASLHWLRPASRYFRRLLVDLGFSPDEGRTRQIRAHHLVFGLASKRTSLQEESAAVDARAVDVRSSEERDPPASLCALPLDGGAGARRRDREGDVAARRPAIWSGLSSAGSHR